MATSVETSCKSRITIGYSTSQKILGYIGIAPACIYLVVFFVIPVVILCLRSVFDPQFTIEHYSRIFREPVYLGVLWITFKISLIVTGATLLLGYPIAYIASRARSRKRKWIILSFILLPFWTSLLVRTFAFIMLLQREGVINGVLTGLGIVSEPMQLVYNLTGVLLGMTYMLLPYMVFPLFSALERIDPIIEQSAISLGATRIRAFCSTTLPLSVPALIAGASLVFLLSLGFFITPALLGGRKEQMLSMVIESQINEVLNWGFAAALCVMLIAAIIVFASLLFVFTGLFKHRIKMI